jgi:hypothetical protein
MSIAIAFGRWGMPNLCLSPFSSGRLRACAKPRRGARHRPLRSGVGENPLARL